MTAKDKAKQLTLMYHNDVTFDFGLVDYGLKLAEKAAAIAVDEIIEIFQSQMPPLTADYWKEVKKHL